jgi:spermidine synthase
VSWFEEVLHSQLVDLGYAQRFKITKVIHQEKTAFQDLIIFENPAFGKVLALDGVIQTTDGDEFIYHEMISHVPMLAHGGAKRVLIVGGGDGGVLREVLRYPVERAVMVEIDGGVVEACKTHMPNHGAGAFDDPRAELLIADGIKFVAETNELFDVVIVDSTDPVGPGEVLFTGAFYDNCKRVMNPGAILITQSGVPFLQGREVTDGYARLKPHFADVGFFVIAVPTYAGGFMTLGWASDDPRLRGQREVDIAERFAAAGLQTRYYTPEVHVAAFALPRFISRLME